MADKNPATDGHSTADRAGFDFTLLPDYDDDLVNEDDIQEFAKALIGPGPSHDDVTSTPETQFITALNDWRPVCQRAIRKGGTKKRKRKEPRRGKDETREGFVYNLLKWPLLITVMGWIICLGAVYLLTRLYIFAYEQTVTMRGKREQLRKQMRAAATYAEWTAAAKEMDQYLCNDNWKEEDQYAYYNSSTVRNVRDEMRRLRTALEEEYKDGMNGAHRQGIVDELRAIIESSCKNNFVGAENARLYSETFYGTKNLVQSFIDETERCLEVLAKAKELTHEDMTNMYRHLHTNFGRTALCLSGGATFAYYHFGVAKALLDAGILPEVITGTSGGALVAALLATRTDEELKRVLVPALAGRINACRETITTWLPRWYRTGARFDSVDWARRCSWFCRGSLTFREAYERTGRILNVTCIPSDPHSPTVLANYLTAPDCVIWSAVLASAAVPGILNPVVLMKKTRKGTIVPYSLNLKDKWKDGSLRTDIPLGALNTHFNVNFSIVSQVNPHINLFFFSSRGTVGRPVTHRSGRGWRGGFLGSAVEQYVKLDLTKWLKVLRHLELLPRYMGQDWSEVWLQRFSGTITIWPHVVASDFPRILSDPDPTILARMIYEGQQSTFPKLKFIANRMKIERLIEAGRHELRDEEVESTGHRKKLAALSEEDFQGLLTQARTNNGIIKSSLHMQAQSPCSLRSPALGGPRKLLSLSEWWTSQNGDVSGDSAEARPAHRRSSLMSELGRQTRVFLDDTEPESDGSVHASTEEWDGIEYEVANQHEEL